MGDVRVTVVDPRPVMTYQPFLPEAAAGSLEPRHVVVPLRAVLRGCRVITGRVTSIDHANHRAIVEPPAGDEYGVDYDHVVVALGSVARTLPIPGLAEQAIGFKHVEEAIALRNQVLGRLDLAASISAASTERRSATATGAHVRLRRRRLRGRRGVRRARGHGPLRNAVLRQPGAEGHALGVGRGRRADPARGRRGHGRATPSSSSAAGRWRSCSTPGSSRASTAMSSCPTVNGSMPTRSCGPQG